MSGEDYNMRISEEVERVPLVISDEFNNGMEQGLPSAEIGQSSSSSNSVVGRGRQPFLRNCSDTVNEHIGKIGYLGSMAIAVNSLTGPAMLNIPDTYQRAGVIPTTVTVILCECCFGWCKSSVVWFSDNPIVFLTFNLCSACRSFGSVSILSSFCCLHMANTISKVPHNSNYQKEVRVKIHYRFTILVVILLLKCRYRLNTAKRSKNSGDTRRLSLHKFSFLRAWFAWTSVRSSIPHKSWTRSRDTGSPTEPVPFSFTSWMVISVPIGSVGIIPLARKKR